MGDIYTAAGYEVVFVDVLPQMVTALNERREYPLRLAGPDRFETLSISPVRAVDGRDVEAVAAELAACDFACTAVGVPALPHLVPALAAGVRKRSRPLNVVLCENQLHCSDLLRGYLAKHLSEEELTRVGLVESVVSRMVPVVTADDPLLAVAEDYPVLPVDASGFVGEIPAVPAFRTVENFPAYVERKLFVHNLGHAAAAYLGYQAGSRFVHEAMVVPEVRSVVEGAMTESSEALIRKHGLDRAEMQEHCSYLQRRFANPALNDTVRRVARDPVRKLRPDDRLIGAALTCLDWDVEPEHIVRAIAAAFRYDAPEDPGAVQVRQTIRDHGPGEALLRYTGQRPDGDLGRRVMDALADR
jgi:mannitol-1-phosphate 5-dehydrogenase